tara:strand:+ start:792 stop:1469 length:678 start_codon:yes stop_codon:yes gene_type:complete
MKEFNIRGVLLEHKLFKISDGKFIRCHTHPDGSCFFHSILIATNLLKNRYSTSSKRRNLGLQLRELLLEEDKWNDFVKNIDRDINNSGIIPSFESIRQASTYACDFVYSFLSQFYHINFIILSSSVSETNAMVIKKIFSDESPTFILAHFGNVEHFEPILFVSNKKTQNHSLISSYNEMLSMMGIQDEGRVKKAQSWTFDDLQNDSYVRGIFSLDEPICKKILSL